MFEASDGTRLITDPYVSGAYGGAVGYKPIDENAHIVLISHDQHPDHNGYETIKGNPNVIKGAGDHKSHGIAIKGVATFHDASSGSERGKNTVFVFEMDGLRVAHCGDLGHVLTEEQVAQIGTIDVLFVPVGGFYTIDASEANQVVQQLSPKIVFPMHYKTNVLGFPIDPIDKYLEGKTNVEYIPGFEVEIKKEDLPEEQKTMVFQAHKY